MSHYYNEIDPHAAACLRSLISAGLIPEGDVDERSIKNVASTDLRGYGQHHFFAGIGGWPHAIDLAGWGTRNVWTGSAPCQPYSTAGKQKGDADARDLWPDFARLIVQCRPHVVFGEQVEGAIKHGWLDRVCRDLEGEGYAVGAAVLGAGAVGAPHRRQRLYWVAALSGVGLADAGEFRRERGPGVEGGRGHEAVWGEAGNHSGHGGVARQQRLRPDAGAGGGDPFAVGHADRDRPAPGFAAAPADGHGRAALADGGLGFWADFDLLPCTDGKARRVEPGTFPLAHGVPGRVGLLRGYGNAVVPQVAAAFVRAFLEAERG